MYLSALAALVVVLTVAIVVRLAAQNASAPAAAMLFHKEWTVTFRDEFAGKSLNKKLWNTCWPLKNPLTCQNAEEAQWYRRTNVATSNGSLRLTMKKQAIWVKGLHCCRYTSGMVTTLGRESFRYGLFEARIKYPPGPGFWTGFWLSPYDYSWPPEIDVAEHLGSEPSHIISAYHYNIWSKGRKTKSTANLAIAMPRNMERGWHTYAVMWEPNILKWYVDSKQVHVYRRCRPGVRPVKNSLTCGPITNKPMGILMTFAMGKAGNPWGGTATPATHFPSTVLVDYIRVSKETGRWTGQRL